VIVLVEVLLLGHDALLGDASDLVELEGRLPCVRVTVIERVRDPSQIDLA
jgi:hypothetical protein